MSLKKIMAVLAVLALVSAPVMAGDKENKGLHLGGLTKEAKNEKIDAKKAGHEAEKAKKEAERQAKQAAKEAEKAKKKAEEQAKKAAKEAEKAKKKAEEEAKKAAKALEAKS